MEAAREGFALWRRTPAPERGAVLKRVGDLLVERKEEIARAATREMGKVLLETRGDVQEGIDTAYYAATEGRRLFGHTVPSELRDKWAMSYRRPIGVAGPDHPLQLPDGHPHLEDVPGAGLREQRRSSSRRRTCRTPPRLLVEILEEAGIPAGVVNLRARAGRGGRAPRSSRTPTIPVISFTGSTDTGRGDRPRLRRDAQAPLAGDGRQERADRDARREHGAGARRRALGRVRHHRPALHRHLAAPPPRRDPRPLPGAPGRARPRAPPRLRRSRTSVDVGPLIHAGRAARRWSATWRSGRRRARSWSLGGERAHGRGARRRLLLPAHDLHRREARLAPRHRGDLRPGALGDPLPRPRRGVPHQQRGALRPLQLPLHPAT